MMPANPHALPSEAVLPFAGLLLRHWIKECERVKDDLIALESACINFWWGMHGLEKIAIALPGTTYFSIANMNEIRTTRLYIMARIGRDPSLDPMFAMSVADYTKRKA